LFARLGIAPSEALFTAGPVPAAISAVAAAIVDLSTAVAALNIAIKVDDSFGITTHGAESLSKIASVITNLASIGATIDSVVQSDGSLSAAQKLRIHNFAAELPKRLLDLMVIDALIANNSALAAGLSMVGLLDISAEPGELSDPTFPAHVSRAIRLDRLGMLIGHPLEHFRSLFGFGLPTFDGLVLFTRLKSIIDNRYELATIIIEIGKPNVLQTPTFALAVDSSANPPGLIIPLRFQSSQDVGLDFAIGEWNLRIDQKGRFGPNAALKISPTGDFAIVPPFGTATIESSLTFGSDRKDKPFKLFGAAGGTIISVESVSISASLRAAWDASSGRASGQPLFAADLKHGKLRISTEGSDGFIAKILSGFQLESTFDLGIDYGLKDGLHFRGSSTLNVQLASHFSVGPLAINALNFSIGIKDDTFPVAVTADIQTSLGPLTAIVHGMGLGVAVKISADNKGNLGPIDIQPGFMPPNGVGLSLDAGGFTGGGFLMFDQAKGEYAGALELDFKGIISVKAIGIINTKMPDGSQGFSLLILISAEFTPIQLSFGFTLNGIGGIIGLNRTLVVSALADGIRTNAIKSILFPENVVANIVRIISDIKQFFPPQTDHFLVGPMIKLGWGTPSIVTLEMGLLLDLPDPMFVIVGVLKAVLPSEDAPILRLQVNFIGVLDFEHGYVFFRADLYDSRLLVFSITGSLAFLVSWGEQQTFAVSVGGFHPDFRDFPSIPALPDGFRNMARIGISLLSDDNPRLKVESYFAVTSNTVQFGARVELYAEAAGFNVYGFLGYDVLFQFEPFRFIANLYGGIALREGTSVIAGISISAKLSGPTPWDARGEASLTILFFEISVDFHVTWGDPPPAISTDTEDLLKLLQDNLADTRNWRAELPANNHMHVSLKKIEPPAGEELLVISPAGVVTFSQRALPLEDYLIQKYGTKKPLNENKFKLSNANSNGTVISADYQGVREQFAPANFTELSDSDKLSRHSFDRLPSGFKLTATLDLQVAGLPVVRDVVYELSYLKRKHLEFKGLVNLALRAYNRLVKGSAVRQSALSRQQNRVSLNAPAQVVLPPESFVIANTADLKPHGQAADGPLIFATQAEAYQRHQELLQQNPNLAGQIQVVSHFELNQS
jgi:hypothetical protein